VRTLTFAIADGAVPSNEGRGYVLRRVLRRAVRYGRQMLGAEAGFLAGLVPVVVQEMGEAFPELRKKAEFVREVVLDEEESFGRTLDRGIKQFEEVAAGAEPSYAVATRVRGKRQKTRLYIWMITREATMEST